MGDSPQQPEPFNANATAKKQDKYNVKSAQRQVAYNRIDQTDPFGNRLDYTQSGVDAQGNPIFSGNQSLGAAGQQYAGGLADLGGRYFDLGNQFLDNPADYTNEATEARIYDLGARRLDPRFEREENALRTRLANMGHDPRNIGPESAYDAEVERFNQGKNDAYNQLLMNARGQAFGEAMQGRQAQVGEFQGLTAPGVNFGTRAMTPQYVNPTNVNTGNVDIQGLSMQQQQDAWNRYNAEMQQRNAMMGGAAQLGGALLMAPMTGGASLGGAIGGAAMGGLSSMGGGLFGGGSQPAPGGGYNTIPRNMPTYYQGK